MNLPQEAIGHGGPIASRGDSVSVWELSGSVVD